MSGVKIVQGAAAALLLAGLSLSAAQAAVKHKAPPQRRAMTRAGAARGSDRYIDPDTGMDCKNYGGVAVCDPPKGTVHYHDPDQGLNCTRTGIVAVCSSFQ